MYVNGVHALTGVNKIFPLGWLHELLLMAKAARVAGRHELSIVTVFEAVQPHPSAVVTVTV